MSVPATEAGQTASPTTLTEADVFKLEETRFKARRKALGVDETLPSVGLALSGGGIRSATICLGVVRSLARHKLLKRIDYLSSVSGGGYAGAFLGSIYARSAARATGQRPAGAADEERRWARSLDYLRQGGRYLVPSGTQDAIHGAAIAIRNWIAVHIVIATSVIALTLLLNYLRSRLWVSGGLADVEAGALSAVPQILWPTTWLDAYGTRDFALSWLWPLALLPLALSIACGWAFWLAGRDQVWRFRSLRLISFQGAGAFAVLLLPFLLRCSDCAAAGPLALASNLASSVEGARALVIASGAMAGLAIAFYAIAEFWEWSIQKTPTPAGRSLLCTDPARAKEEDRVRSWLSKWCSFWIACLLAVSAAALVDTVGNYIYTLLRTATPIAAIGVPTITSTVVILALRDGLRRAPKILEKLPGGGTLTDRIKRFGRQIALVAGILLVILLFGFWASIAHVISWRLEPLGSLMAWSNDPRAGAAGIGWTAIAFVVLAFLMGKSMPFLNLSSFAAFYAGRLRRAYLGASNPERFETTGSAGRAYRFPVDKDHEKDDLTLGQYYDPQSMAPIHLINVTINETTSRYSRVIQRDRKGKPLIVSPFGYLYSGQTMRDPMRASALSLGEQLPLSSWIGISGAAFSTGVGHYTTLGQSLIAGLANMRLGYWWRAPTASSAGSEASESRSAQARQTGLDILSWLGFRVQSNLAREFWATFRGTDARYWYLSDGGHFENTGAYALLRRQVEFIIVCDSGADPDYAYDDIANLVRKARIDLDAEIGFLSHAELDAKLGSTPALRQAFGALDDLASTELTHKAGPYAALAEITYHGATSGPRRGTLVLLKPRLCGLEARDILRYRQQNKKFPQQSTLDQFFDEAQWESHYELGRRMADVVFGAAPVTIGQSSWAPSHLEPLPAS